MLEGFKDETPLFFIDLSGYAGSDPKYLRVEKTDGKIKLWDEIPVEKTKPTPPPGRVLGEGENPDKPKKKKGSLTITRRQKKKAIPVEE